MGSEIGMFDRVGLGFNVSQNKKSTRTFLYHKKKK